MLLCVHPALNGQKVKAARKAMANYLILPYARNIQDPTPGTPMFRLSVGPTLLFDIKGIMPCIFSQVEIPVGGKDVKPLELLRGVKRCADNFLLRIRF
ncbi:hypothetical protein PoB_004867300 [Plakobranchus ocellatus]|uniref:Uncharacterized protein n=1 Tax=Plakobranchus ocellatus TaxID=259542 RepID=A0AAV4BTP6_9GAST|nr:hypothetical protein PoB_004867300 [Plakobranchus ocellatus]